MNVTANGISMHYTLEGPATAPVVTLSHSLATDLTMWEPQARALAARYRVLRYDTRGHGGTDVPPGSYSLEQLADDVRALLDALEIDRTHFVGLSMGGMIGQTLALKAPRRLTSLVLCDTSSRVPPEAKAIWDERIGIAETQGMEPLVEPTLARWLTPPFRERRADVAETVRGMIRRTPPGGYAGCSHAIAALDLTDRLPAIKLPTLIVVGEDDPATTVAVSRVIHEQINGSQLVILKSASHLSNLEQPEAFTAAVTEFLDKLG
jgi:3-oxoadipate enol-lactonase